MRGGQSWGRFSHRTLTKQLQCVRMCTLKFQRHYAAEEGKNCIGRPVQDLGDHFWWAVLGQEGVSWASGDTLEGGIRSQRWPRFLSLPSGSLGSS